MIRLLWHLWRHGHSVQVNRHLTAPTFDPSSRGWLVTCECGLKVAR